MRIHIYRGKIGDGGRYIERDDIVIELPSGANGDCGTNGFDWGTEGRGSYCTALAILLDLTADEVTALRLAEPFAIEVIWKIPQNEEWEIRSNDIWLWVHEMTQPELGGSA